MLWERLVVDVKCFILVRQEDTMTTATLQAVGKDAVQISHYSPNLLGTLG